ncbi:MAG: hypothetical protein ABI693_08685 [Bryobacteraceae bacterium]
MRVVLLGLFAMQALALPTMIRLGYPNCVSCHISPQGGGLLNVYGRGIDQAQSLAGGEYKPSDNEIARLLSWQGRITQDVRMVGQEVLSTSPGQPVVGVSRSRFMYRNATELGGGFRFSALIMGENIGAPRPSRAYDHALIPGTAMIVSALLQYRPAKKNLEFAVGRDALPTGVYVPDLGSYIRSRNRGGYYDNPTQIKMFWWGKRYQITPFVFGPGGHEAVGERETGGGTLAEFDLLGKQRTVIGATVLRASAAKGERRLMGAYTRLGFGKWGVLAEHDITDRTFGSTPSFRQQATYVQPFWALREWLVGSLVGERLTIDRPYRESLTAGKVELAMRLRSQMTVTVGFRMQRNMLTGGWSPAATLQLALKTVN